MVKTKPKSLEIENKNNIMKKTKKKVNGGIRIKHKINKKIE